MESRIRCDMSGIYDDTNRQIMPRWYPFRRARQLGDLEPVSRQDSLKPTSTSEFVLKVKEW